MPKTITIGDETKSVFEWGYEYDISTSTIYSRLKKGITGYQLLDISKSNISKEFMHKIWGGKWIYTGNKIKKKKWVYIGEQEAKKDELEEIYDRIQRDRLAEVSE